MSKPPLDSFDPHKPPLAEHKLTPAEAADVKHRDIAIFVLLNVITLGIYWFYLVYQWAKELNGLQGSVKYKPVVVLVVSILTCGLGGMVFECLYAFDITHATQSRGIGDRAQLGTWVIVLNSVALVVSLIPFAVIVGLPLGILASVLVQVELNKLAARYPPSQTG